MQLGTTPNRPKPGTHYGSSAGADRDELAAAPPLCVYGMGRPQEPQQAAGQAQQMQAGRQQARRWSRRQAPRRPQGMDTGGRQDDCRDGRPARQRGAQSRTEDAQPQAVRIAENVTVYLHPDDVTPAARTGHSPAADRRETTVHCQAMSIEGYERINM